ncbi:serine/threonine protein phosphatase [Phaeobacter inhibens]|uniref:metallophosphoesterase family protein n=1 Tax=Phaeobacter inhibens TaxID=221822 RepID=UPI0021A5C4BF|nr:metallophosphoesterase family protein [Phaeobacter inhibens]UWR45830.1 serine/threonine protein phosphatase [Phaeobacter inhibens]UWR80957.1 serine/threonine protein phosphatase [Phaeobacter inhibens]
MPQTRNFSLPQRPLPGTLPPGIELFVIGDVHGRADQLAAILEAIWVIDRTAEKRVLIFLGDLIDRGPESLRAIRLALEAGTLAGVDELHLLPGNHELALLDVLNGGDHQLWLANGGRALLVETAQDTATEPFTGVRERLASSIPEEFISAIHSAPSHVRIGDLLMVHAGLDPDASPEEHLDRHRPLSDSHWAGIRHKFLCFTDGWDYGEEGYFKGATVVVHGHTPAVREDLNLRVEAMAEMDGIDDYRAICLDAGASTRPQIGWAHFYSRGGETMCQIFTAVGSC